MNDPPQDAGQPPRARTAFDWGRLRELNAVRAIGELASRYDARLTLYDRRGEPTHAAGGPALAVSTDEEAALVPTATGQAMALAPIRDKSERLGFVGLGPLAPDTFTGSERRFLCALAATAALEIARFVSSTTAHVAQDARDVHPRYPALIGTSPAMQQLFWLLDRVIDSESTVLIHGENGTGKELCAKAIHANSRRRGQAFVVQNCSAFNDNLLDSELFGHKRGAFTGAVVDKRGLFEVADGGTFFLDEIGEMSPALQVKLLRVLQEGTFIPVGDTNVKRVDVRIIAATNRDLERMMKEGSFREDLFYRINVISIVAPPLRRRREDVETLAEHFLDVLATTRRGPKKHLTRACLECLEAYSWPGNVRELENEIERLVVLKGDGSVIDEGLLSSRIRQPAPGLELGPDDPGTLPQAVENLERAMIYRVLSRNEWNKTRAAAELRISRRNLIRKVQKYGLEK